MQNLRNKLIAGGAVLILAAIGTMMNSHPALGQAPGGATVTINPGQLPLPVKGATTVSGTVAATQSGTWNVGLTGTPNVNVANPATAPALFLNVNDPGRIPYQSEVNSLGGGCTTSGCNFNFGPVPANHRLVVEHVTGSIIFTSAQSAAFVTVIPSSGSFTIHSAFVAPITAGILGQNIAAFDQPVHFCVDPTQGFRVLIDTTFLNFNTNAAHTVTVTGYLLDCTAGPCASIASF
jgi:hypothetical protein